MERSDSFDSMMTRRVVRLLAITGVALYGCQAGNQMVGDHPGTMATAPEPSLTTETTREVLTKKALDTLIACGPTFVHRCT